MPRPFDKKRERKILTAIWEAHYNSALARDSEFMPRFVAAMKVYMDQTITTEERRLLQERGQSDVSVNYLRFFLRKMQAFMTANQPEWMAFGVNNEDRRSALLANAILSHGWRISKGYLQVSDIIKNGTVGGLGLFSVYVDYRKRNGLGDVAWRSLPVQYFYPDWRSMDPMFDDMSYQQVSYTVSLNTALKIAPDRKDDIVNLSTVPENYDTLFQEGALSYGEFPDPQQLDRVRLLTHYQLEEQDVWELRDLVDGEVYRIKEKPDLPLPYSVDVKKISVPTLVKYDCMYGMGEDDGIIYNVTKFPFSNFLIKPFIDEYTGNPFPVGEAYFLEKLQKYLDKSLRVALQHEQWNSNPGTFVPRGSIDDIEEFEKRINLPGFVEEVDFEFGTPVFKQGTPGQTGFYKVMEFMIETMRFGTGNMFDPKMSKGNATEDQLLKTFGQEQGDMIFRNFESALEESAKSFLELAKWHYDFPATLKFIDKRKRPVAITINRAFVNERGEIDGYYIKTMDTDIALATKSYAPTDKFFHAERIIKAMQFSPPEVLDSLFKELIKAMELDPELVDEIEAKLQIVPQLVQQLEQLSQALDELQRQNKQLQSQVFTADRKAVRATYDAELQKQVDKFKNDIRALLKVYEANLKVNQKIKQAITQNKGSQGERNE